jgi:hypothetical protein
MLAWGQAPWGHIAGSIFQVRHLHHLAANRALDHLTEQLSPGIDVLATVWTSKLYPEHILAQYSPRFHGCIMP